ncbi:hypothetical protein [Kiloniella antarctica]|uniref:Uncharacterized protein n=1 Tax=Kiloniella antarctica TaxID=1550907 RepID=A0ABW5BNA6_9PROT
MLVRIADHKISRINSCYLGTILNRAEFSSVQYSWQVWGIGRLLSFAGNVVSKTR